MTWKPTKFRGVRYREHPTRKYGIHPDRYFAIRYKQKGVSREEGLGWASEKWTAEKAAAKLADLKKAYKTGTGEPTRLIEARQAEKERREQEALEKERQKLEKAQQEKENITFGQFFIKTYCPIAEHSKKRGSYLNELSHFKYWIEPAIGAIPLKDLRPIHLERLKKTLLEAGKIEVGA